MGDAPTKFLIDGIDRLGKSSLIKRIQDEFGYHLVIHYDKPKILHNNMFMAKCIKTSAGEDDFDESYFSLSEEDMARRFYQEDTNLNMFKLLQTDIPLILDRTHLGEMVYAPLYRKYSGDYVYKMEQELISAKPYSYETDIRLILLTSSNTDMLVDDGLGFDPTKKNEEQDMFIKAFNRSALKNKVIVDVHNGSGGYKSYEEVFQEAIYKRS